MKTQRSVSLLLVLVSGLVLCPHGSVSAQETEPKAQSPAEPPAPKPSPTVQKILEEASQFAKAKKNQDALTAADQALTAAQQAGDPAGEALAYRSRALALEELDRKEEALVAWREAAAAWNRVHDGPGQIEAIAAEALLLVTPGKQAEAEELLTRALAIGKEEARRPLAASQAMYQAGYAIYHKYKRGLRNWAGELLAGSLAIQEKLAPNSLELVETLNALGNVCVWKEDLPAAEKYLNRALVLGEKEAPNSLAVAHTLDGLGDLEHARDNLAESATYSERALALKEKLVPDSMDLSKTLEALGNNSRHQDLLAAQRFHQRALEIREKLDPESIGVAISLSNLAIVAESLGNLADARDYLTRALSIEEKLFGRDSVGTAKYLINLGDVANDKGDYAAARHYYERALSIYDKLAPNSGGVPVALSNLGEVAYEQGDLSSALQYDQRALAIDEKRANLLGVAEGLSDLGKIFRAQGALVEAEASYRRALDILEKHAPDSLELAGSYQGLGELAYAKGDLSVALDYQHRALIVRQKAAPGSLDVAWSLYRLGELAYVQGDFADALQQHQGALDIRQRATGPDNPDVAQSLLSIAKVQAEMGDTSAALDAALRAENIGREHLRISAQTLSERQALAYASGRAPGLDLALTLTADVAEKPIRARDVFDSLIRSRALVFDEMAARHHAVHVTDDPDVSRLAKQLLSARTRLATLVVRGPGDNSAETYRKLLDEARKENEAAERALAEKSAAFRQEQARAQIGINEIAASLPPQSALVGFTRYGRYELTRRSPGGKPLEPTSSYLAFILRKGKSETVVVTLGKAEEIDPLVSRWREQFAQESLGVGLSSKHTEAGYRRAAAELRRRIWDPLSSYLRAAKFVFVVPDGALHLVNLAALPVGRESYLIETGPPISYLTTERDLVPASTGTANQGLLALGAPNFDETRLFAALAQQSKQPQASDAVQLAALHTFRGNRSACGQFQSMRFEALPASGQEVMEIVSVWKKSSSLQQENAPVLRGMPRTDASEALYLIGDDATEAAFKQQAPGKRVLHLATHGFFLGGHCASALDPSLKPTSGMQPASVTGENPLLLSGLALAGANHRQAAGLDEDDGILTAEEIAAMDLEGVEWAVLSGCDTGVGEVKAGEGVFGLRRAFQVAGARTVIMSLWSVEDRVAREWMTTMYQNRFVKSLSTAESVRNASLAVLRQRRAKNLSTHPFYWGGFVATGEWH